MMKQIGERLKKARESKGLSLDQAHAKTRIHINVLKALEEGRIDELLSVPYAKGFLKKYAAFLGLSGDEILNEYLSFHAESKEGAKLAKIIPQKGFKVFKARPRIRLYPHALIFIISALLLAALTSYLKSHKPKSHPKVKTVKVASPVKSSSFPVKRQIPKLQVAAKALQTPAISIPKNESIVVTLVVRRNVLVEISKDGNLLFWHVLREGSRETVKAKEKVNLAIADIESLDIIVNGKPLAVNRKGEIRDLEITRSGIRIK